MLNKCEEKNGAFVIPDSVLSDLCSRFIINVPEEERNDLIRVFFQIEIAHWFYLDFYCDTGSTGSSSSASSGASNCSSSGSSGASGSSSSSSSSASASSSSSSDDNDEEQEDANVVRQRPSSLGSTVPLKPCSIRAFAENIFRYCPFLMPHSHNVEEILSQWKVFKHAVPTNGAIIIDESARHVLLVQGFWAKASWGFPKGKVIEEESEAKCARREVLEETGFDIGDRLRDDEYLQININDQTIRLYLVRNVSRATHFEPRTRREIKDVRWFAIDDLPVHRRDVRTKHRTGYSPNAFFMVIPFVKSLRQFIAMKNGSLNAQLENGCIVMNNNNNINNNNNNNSMSNSNMNCKQQQQQSKVANRSQNGKHKRHNSHSYPSPASQHQHHHHHSANKSHHQHHQHQQHQQLSQQNQQNQSITNFYSNVMVDFDQLNSLELTSSMSRRERTISNLMNPNSSNNSQQQYKQISKSNENLAAVPVQNAGGNSKQTKQTKQASSKSPQQQSSSNNSNAFLKHFSSAGGFGSLDKNNNELLQVSPTQIQMQNKASLKHQSQYYQKLQHNELADILNLKESNVNISNNNGNNGKQLAKSNQMGQNSKFKPVHSNSTFANNNNNNNNSSSSITSFNVNSNKFNNKQLNGVLAKTADRKTANGHSTNNGSSVTAVAAVAAVATAVATVAALKGQQSQTLSTSSSFNTNMNSANANLQASNSSSTSTSGSGSGSGSSLPMMNCLMNSKARKQLEFSGPECWINFKFDLDSLVQSLPQPIFEL